MSLILRNISHRFGKTIAVADAGFEAAPGQIVCLYGPSGCGKTTLLRIAAGLERLQQGVVELNGTELAAPGRETAPEKRPIGFVFQDFVLFPHLTVENNIAFGLNGARNGKARVKAQIDAMGLSGLGQRFPHELSGGQQQRTALARALVREPDALLLDEPFASIDTALRRRLREELRQMLKAQGVSVVMVTHDPEEALALGDQLVLMRTGRVVEAGSPENLFENPQSPDGAGLFPGSQRLAGKVGSNRLYTDFGDFHAPGIPDGPGIAVIRDGAIEAIADPDGAYEVADIRFIGPGWIAWLATPEARAGLRVGLGAGLEIGDRVALTAAPDGIFVFAEQ